MRINHFNIPNLRFFEGEGEGGGTGGAPVGDTGNAGNPQGDTPQDTGGINPSWSKLLEVIPQQLHPGVTPHLREWDKNFETRVSQELSKVQSQYAPLEAFKDQDPERINQALTFFQMAESDPRLVYDELARYFEFEQGDQGQLGQEDLGDEEQPEFDINQDDIMQHPKVQELLQNQEVIAQYFVQQQQEEEQRALEAQIDTEHQSIVQANPDFSEDDLVMMYQIATASNISLTDAAERVKGYSENVATRRQAPYAPPVLSSNRSGAVPAENAVDPRKLNSQQTQNLVADLIRQAQNG